MLGVGIRVQGVGFRVYGVWGWDSWWGLGIEVENEQGLVRV